MVQVSPRENYSVYVGLYEEIQLLPLRSTVVFLRQDFHSTVSMFAHPCGKQGRELMKKPSELEQVPTSARRLLSRRGDMPQQECPQSALPISATASTPAAPLTSSLNSTANL